MQLGITLVVPRQRIGVGLVAINEEGDVLLLQHVFHPFTPWGLPGGWLKRNEHPKDGVLRELQEETGLYGVVDRPILVNYDSHPPHIGIAYRGKIISGEISLSPEIMAARWFADDELPSSLDPFVRQAIQAAKIEVDSLAMAFEEMVDLKS